MNIDPPTPWDQNKSDLFPFSHSKAHPKKTDSLMLYHVYNLILALTCTDQDLSHLWFNMTFWEHALDAKAHSLHNEDSIM